jgi:hypothetical protein
LAILAQPILDAEYQDLEGIMLQDIYDGSIDTTCRSTGDPELDAHDFTNEELLREV